MDVKVGPSMATALKSEYKMTSFCSYLNSLMMVKKNTRARDDEE